MLVVPEIRKRVEQRQAVRIGVGILRAVYIGKAGSKIFVTHSEMLRSGRFSAGDPRRQLLYISFTEAKLSKARNSSEKSKKP